MAEVGTGSAVDVDGVGAGMEVGGRMGDSLALPLRVGEVLLLPFLLSEAGTVPLPMRKLLVGAFTAGGILAEGGGFTGTAVRRDGGRGGAGEEVREEVVIGEGALLVVEVEMDREREEERERGAESRRTALYN